MKISKTWQRLKDKTDIQTVTVQGGIKEVMLLKVVQSAMKFYNMNRFAKIYIQRKAKKLEFRFSFLLQLYHMLKKLYMIPRGREHNVLISIYCSPAANSNICHPLKVQLGKHWVWGLTCHC